MFRFEATRSKLIKNKITSAAKMRECFLKYFKNRFFSAVPLRQYDRNIINELINLDISEQKELLDETVNSTLNKMYAVSTKYQQEFLKLILTKLEENNLEISDELYETYCSIMSCQLHDEVMVYKHFFFDDNASHVIIKESSSIVSNGTTGLYSWEASMALADWCLNESKQFDGKTILELGSGAGLLGLSILANCKPSAYWFSDCHPNVLNLLKANIILNQELIGGLKDLNVENNELEHCSVYKGLFKDSELRILYFPWEDAFCLKADIILAADVVYDSTLLPHLCSALKKIIASENSFAIIACTVRNEETLAEFLNQSMDCGLEVLEETLPSIKHFFFVPHTPIKIFKILLKG